MIGSPDLVAFTKDDDFGEAFLDPLLIPEEFSVPLFTHDESGSPWTKTNYAKFSKDFILISEFSEQVGPQPLLTIPDDPKVCGTFDLNYFSLRIMSVDYQASFIGHPPGCGYPKLNFVEDSKVVLGDSKEGAFAYVHHLTLYDLEARGFVRPFCMAYVSADERKIMQQFQELSSGFSKASECLKTGNRKAFANELEKKLKDLEYTRTVLHAETEMQKINNGCYSSQAIEKANELANVEKSIYEHKDLLKQIMSYPNRKKKDGEVLPYESDVPTDVAEADQKPACGSSPDDQAGDPSCERVPSYTPQLIKAKSAKCFDKRLKTLEELCDLCFFDQTLDQLRLIENTLRGDLCYIYTRQINQALLKKQKITNFLFEEYKDWEEEEVAKQFCNGNIFNLPLPISILSPEQMSLESYTSCGQTFQVKIEPEPSAEGLKEETMSSPRDLAQENSDKCIYAEIKGSVNSGESIEIIVPENYREVQRPSVTSESPTNAQTRHLDPITPEDLQTPHPDVVYQENAFLEDCAGVVCEQVHSAIDQDSDMNSESIYERGAVVQGDAACCMGQEGPMYEDLLPDLAQESRVGVVRHEPKSYLQVDPSGSADFTHVETAFSGGPSAGLSLNELSSNCLSDETSRMNLDDFSDSTSFMSASTSSDRTSSPFLRGNPITVKHKKKAGQRALRFIRQYPFAQQAIFCLLSGRTLVVLGNDEGIVRKLVNALTIFVPNLGKYGEAVQPWLSSPFQLTDLQNWKLIGLHRMASPTGSSMLHSLNRYIRYIGILDTDHKTLRGPSYRGALVGRMADHRTQIKRGSTYFLHLQSMLTKLTSKAFLYTFCHHLHLPISPGEGEASVAYRRDSFLHNHLGYSEGDAKIVRFLSELIKQCYLGEPGQRVSPPVFYFDYVTSFLYKI